MNDPRDMAAMRGGANEPVLIRDDGTEVPLPFIYEVCPLCSGKGTHVNPSIDSHGLTAEDFHEDPGFREEYLSGRFDQTCNECHGDRVVPVVDLDRVDPALLKEFREEQLADAEFEAMAAAERRMGA